MQTLHLFYFFLQLSTLNTYLIRVSKTSKSKSVPVVLRNLSSEGPIAAISQELEQENDVKKV
jgi:hypothetical protein